MYVLLAPTGRQAVGVYSTSLSAGVCKDNDAQVLMSHVASVERVVQESVDKCQMGGHGTPNI
jgi:hypothetical protein